jgi:signal peptidase I
LTESANPTDERVSRLWREWRGFLLFVVVMVVFRSAVADWNQVPTGSMKPSILIGDRIVVDKLAYDLRIPFTLVRLARWAQPERGDVVTFPSPIDETQYVKRVIGLPGDTIELRKNHLFVNGEAARYTELGDDEVAAIEVENKELYRFFREEIGTMSHLIMRAAIERVDYQSWPAEVPANTIYARGQSRR